MINLRSCSGLFLKTRQNVQILSKKWRDYEVYHRTPEISVFHAKKAYDRTFPPHLQHASYARRSNLPFEAQALGLKAGGHRNFGTSRQVLVLEYSGLEVGLVVGELVGLVIGWFVGSAVGEVVGVVVGELVGLVIGLLVG